MSMMQPEVQKAHLEFLRYLIPDIQNGTAIPIISNSFRLDQIFGGAKDLLEKIDAEPIGFYDEYNTIEEKLTKTWAEDIKYPMPDDHNLARVAQYYQVEQDNNEIAKSRYLDFLKKHLLTMDENTTDYAEYVNGVKDQIEQHHFSTIATSLGYPRYAEGSDPLSMLANLPIKIYITTSYFKFIEQALEKAKKTPHTIVCFWNKGESKALPIHRMDLDPDRDITEKTPLVYHLFGLEDYPNSLVLSEDDYMNFLVSVFEDTNQNNPKVPTYLKKMLAERRLILLGYHLRDWDFRVLFKFIMKYRARRVSEDDDMPRGILIQLKPSPKKVEDEGRSIKYLEQYFGKKQFDVDWSKASKFINELSRMYDTYRGKAKDG
jgi:hypothetical protein